jgi:hypothetical protein
LFLQFRLECRELIPRACEYGPLHFELLAGHEIELAEGCAKHCAEVLLEVLANCTKALGHGLDQFAGDVLDGFIVHADVIPDRQKKRQLKIRRPSP